MRFTIELDELENLTPVDKLWMNLPKLSVEEVRKDIVILEKNIYLDSAATSLTPKPVIEEIVKYFTCYNSNIERGGYFIADYATNLFHKAHAIIAKKLLKCSSHELISTKNMTEGMNMVAYYLMQRKDLFGKNIIISDIEHHSNMLPWIRLAKNSGIELKVLKTNNGYIDVNLLEEMIDDNTILISVQHGSNITGIEHDVYSIGEICKRNNVLLAIDGAQVLGHQAVDVKAIGCDFYAFSGHKGPMGPTGTGGLYVKEELIENRIYKANSNLKDMCTLGVHKFTNLNDYVEVLFPPMVVGGGCISDVNYDNYVFTESPSRYHAGTPNIANEIALGRAALYVSEQIGFENIVKREKLLIEKLLKGLLNMDSVEVYGPHDLNHKTGIVSFNIKGKKSYEVAAALNEKNICLRAGVHCVMPWHKEHDLIESVGTVRASVHYYNTEDEIDALLCAIEDIIK